LEGFSFFPLIFPLRAIPILLRLFFFLIFYGNLQKSIVLSFPQRDFLLLPLFSTRWGTEHSSLRRHQHLPLLSSDSCDFDFSSPAKFVPFFIHGPVGTHRLVQIPISDGPVSDERLSFVPFPGHRVGGVLTTVSFAISRDFSRPPSWMVLLGVWCFSIFPA